MIRELLLCLVSCGILGVSGGSYDLTEVPVCEDMAPFNIYLDLSNMNLDAIRKPIASSSMITCLNLAGNHIGEIVPDAFDGLPELYYLNLAESPIWYNTFTQTNLSKLRTLILDGPFISDNDNHRSISNYYNYEKSLSFVLPKLEKLSLQHYGDDKRDLIWYSLRILHVPNLTHLYLTGNALEFEQLRNVIFTMNNLTHLYLDNTGLSVINGISLPNLRYLSLNRNRIENLGNGNSYYYINLRNTYNLEYLSLAANEIVTIAPNAFESSEKLRFLNLARNKIGHFPREVSTQLANLKNLTLDYNLLTSVPHVCELKQLRSLSLSGNNITSINETTFCNLNRLSAIYLQNIGLNNIEDKTFGNLPALLVLDLSWNHILFLPEHWMAPRNFIIELHLDGNMFIDIESMSLKRVHGLQTLSIGYNPMETITILSLMNLPNSTRIDVSRNRLSVPTDLILS